MTRALLITLVCAVALAVASPAAAQEEPVSILFAQSATHGSLEPTACRCGGRRILTLRQQSAEALGGGRWRVDLELTP